MPGHIGRGELVHTELTANITSVTAVTQIVAAPGVGNRILILGWTLRCDADDVTTTAQWHSNATVIPFSPTLNVLANNWPHAPESACGNAGFLACDVNESLRFSAGLATSGEVTYAII